MTTGNAIDAKRASVGLINSVLALAKLDAGIDETVERLASARRCHHRNQAGMAYSQSHTLAECLEFEAVHQKACLESEDS